MVTEKKDFRGFDSSRDIVDFDIPCPEIIEWLRVDKTFEGRTVVMLTPRYDRGKGMFEITDLSIDITPTQDTKEKQK